MDTAVQLLRYGASLGLVDGKQRSIYSGCHAPFLKPLTKRLSEWKEDVEMFPQMKWPEISSRSTRKRRNEETMGENGLKKRRISQAAGPETLKRWAQQKVPENVIPTGVSNAVSMMVESLSIFYVCFLCQKELPANILVYFWCSKSWRKEQRSMSLRKSRKSNFNAHLLIKLS